MAAVRTGHPAGLRLSLAAGFAAHRDGTPVADQEIGSRKARALLQLLAVHRGRPVSVEAAVAALWGDAAPRRPADNVATLVSRLRSALGADVVQGDRDGYRLGPLVEVDLDIADRHLAEARRRLTTEPALALAAAQAAVELLKPRPPETGPDWAETARADADRSLASARLLAAEAALDTREPGVALAHASDAIAAEPYDEPAYRLAMRAHAALGAPARALALYEHLRELLASEFGVDPAAETREVHLAVLREEPAARSSTPSPRQPEPSGSPLVGRAAEMASLTARWNAASAGEPGLVLLAGEAGIGKTRLSREVAELALATGGQVLSARCYETERSLFLQPIAEAIGQHAAHTSPSVLRRLAADWDAPLTQLVPELAAALGRSDDSGDPEVQRQRAYRAVTEYLCRLASAPVLLVLDDLHTTGLATVELLHYLVRRAGSARLLVVATVRADEGAAAIEALTDVATMVELGPLDGAAVARLAAEAGHAEQAGTISARTGGHPLFVVETLRGLASGVHGVPHSLQAAVLARVRRASEPVEQLLRAASVLGATIDLEPLANLLDMAPVRAIALCEQALAARLLVVADRAYEFANDLIREVLYASVPAPTRIAFHRRAAELLDARPEAVAHHAEAAGDLPRAARAWLLAGEEAERSLATADAEQMLSRAVDTATLIGELEVIGRGLLARGRVRDYLARYDSAIEDFRAAVDVARESGDRRLEMLAHQALGSDIREASSSSGADDELHHAIRLAAALGDRATESELLARLGIVACNRLNLVAGLDYSRRAVAAARAAHDDVALAAALDGLKTSHAYLGDNAALGPILAELEPMLRQQKDMFRLPWLVQERGFAAIAAADWDTAMATAQEALDLNRRSGYRAFESWFVGNVAWILRLRGNLDASLEWARRAVELTSDGRHAWWRAAANAELGCTLMALGDKLAARDVLAAGLALAATEGAEAYQLRCLGPLADCRDDLETLEAADRLLASVKAPAGMAWLPGANAYLGVARGWRAAGRDDRADAILQTLRYAAEQAGWHWVAAEAAGA